MRTYDDSNVNYYALANAVQEMCECEQRGDLERANTIAEILWRDFNILSKPPYDKPYKEYADANNRNKAELMARSAYFKAKRDMAKREERINDIKAEYGNDAIIIMDNKKMQ